MSKIKKQSDLNKTNKDIETNDKKINYAETKIEEVVEKKSNVSSITWTLNRMNGDIETFLQSSEADVFNKVRNGEYKVRRYGNCQKFKNNVL